MIKYLLDTNIVIFTMKRRPPSLLPKFNHKSHLMAISSITLGELVFGAEKSSNPAKNLAAVEEFTSRLMVLPYDEHAAFHYGGIRAALEKQGKRIGDMTFILPGMPEAEG